MNQRFNVRSLASALAVVACITGAAIAQEDTMPARPMYGHPKPVLSTEAKTPATPLTTWNGTYTYSGKTYKYNMVGGAPTTGSTTIDHDSGVLHPDQDGLQDDQGNDLVRCREPQAFERTDGGGERAGVPHFPERRGLHLRWNRPGIDAVH